MTTDVSRDERTRDETPLPAQPISAEVLVEKYAKGGERSAAEVRRRVARALAAGEAPTYVARLLGHSDCRMLLSTYARYMPNALGRTDGLALQRAVDAVATAIT